VKEIKEVLSFIISLGESLAASLEDGEITIFDAAKFWEPISKVSDAFEGLDKVVDELAHLGSDELILLVEWAKEEFDIPQDDIELTIEQGVTLAVQLLSFVIKLKK